MPPFLFPPPPPALHSLCLTVYTFFPLCLALPSPCRRKHTLPGWGWTAMQVADKEVQHKIQEDNPNYIDIIHVPPAQSMLRRIVYVVLCRPRSPDVFFFILRFHSRSSRSEVCTELGEEGRAWR